jgi:hypothetical protein
VQLYLNELGKITSMPPEFDVLLSRSMLPPSRSEGELLYSPDRVLLSDQPGLLAWD